MAIFRVSDLNKFTNNRDKSFTAILLFGPNQAKIRSAAKEITIAVVGSLDDPFSIDTLEEKQIKETPGLLRDQAMSLSFMGDSKIINIREPGIAAIKQIPDYLSVHDSQNLLLVEAGNLTKTSGLRKMFEKAKNAASIAFYDDTPAELISLITEKFSTQEKSIDQNTARALLESVGNHRGLIEQEIEKLVSYAGTNTQISIQDIEQLSGDPLADSLEALCDFAILGNTTSALIHAEQLALTGTQPAQMLNVISMHLLKILSLKAEIDKGQAIDNLIRFSRPPIFFKRQPTVKKQIAIWNQRTLKTALKTTFEAIANTRKSPELASTICERTILNLGAMARRR